MCRAYSSITWTSTQRNDIGPRQASGILPVLSRSGASAPAGDRKIHEGQAGGVLWTGNAPVRSGRGVCGRVRQFRTRATARRRMA